MEPGAEDLRQLRSLALELWRSAHRARRAYATQSPLARNPALGDMLADFSRSAGVAARQLGELLARLGEPPPSGSPRGEVVARFRAWLTGLGGDTAIARAGLAAEQKDEQMLASLVEKLARAGADPEALQRLTEARASSRHRIELFREVLGVPKPSA